MSNNHGRLCRDGIVGNLQIKSLTVLDQEANLCVRDAKMKGDMKVKGDARGDTELCGDLKVQGDTELCGDLKVQDKTELCDDVSVTGCVSANQYKVAQELIIDSDRNIVDNKHFRQIKFPKGHLCGFCLKVLTNIVEDEGDIDYVETTTQLLLGPGDCRDHTNCHNICLDHYVTIDLATGLGAEHLDVGGPCGNAWYAVYVIASSTDAQPTSALVSLDFYAPTLPAGYDIFRRVGCARTHNFGFSLDEVSWDSEGGSSSFDTDSISFAPISNVTYICFQSKDFENIPYVHSHEDSTTVTIEIYNGSSLVQVFEKYLDSGYKEIQIPDIKLCFPETTVSGIRFSASPGPDYGFHNMDELCIQFGTAEQALFVPLIQKSKEKTRWYGYDWWHQLQSVFNLPAAFAVYMGWQQWSLGEFLPPTSCLADIKVQFNNFFFSNFSPSNPIMRMMIRNPESATTVTGLGDQPDDEEKNLGAPIIVWGQSAGGVHSESLSITTSPNQNIQAVMETPSGNPGSPSFSRRVSMVVTGFHDELSDTFGDD
jgi:hypothetical protein